MSGKSTGALHAIAYDLWQHEHPSWVFIGKTATELSDRGLWQHFCDHTMPEWIAGDFGMRWIKTPRFNRFQKPYLEVSNRFGGVSTCYLDSLEHEKDVEAKFKGKEFTGIYMPELSKHRDRMVFDILADCLRSPIPNIKTRFIGDTNPAPEGPDSWIYKVWYEERVADPSRIEDLNERERVQVLQQQLGLIEFTIDDNIFLSPLQKAEQKARWSKRKDLYERYYLGLWTKASAEGYFEEVFHPNIHVVGEAPSTANEEPEILMPQPNCAMLYTGWDTGQVNHSIHILDKWSNKSGLSHWSVLDEVSFVGLRVKLADVVEAVMELMDFWESQIGRKIRWRHVSDKSMFAQYIPSGDTFDAKEIYKLSDGRIELEPSNAKQPGSMMKRAEFMARLLYENRIAISKRCPRLIETISSIEASRSGKFRTNDPLKHAFDSSTYLICDECWSEIDDDPVFRVSTPTGAGVVTTPL